MLEANSKQIQQGLISFLSFGQMFLPASKFPQISKAAQFALQKISYEWDHIEWVLKTVDDAKKLFSEAKVVVPSAIEIN